MTVFKFFSRFVSVVWFTISCADADIINSTSELKTNQRAAAYFTSPTVVDAIAQMALAKEKKFGVQPDCNNYEAKLLMLDLLSPLDFPAEQEHPVKGHWRAIIALNRCGQQRVYTGIFVAVDQAVPKSKFLHAGISLASETLMGDAIGYARLSILIKDPATSECKDVEFFNTAITERPALTDPQSSRIVNPWKETWSFWLCGKVHSVGLRFEPDKDGNGTRFFVDARLPVKSR